MVEEPDIQQMVRYLYSRAVEHEAAAAKLADQMAVHTSEAKKFRRLAEDMKAGFPESEIPEEEKSPLLTNLPLVSFEQLQEHLKTKRGRVKHVAKRLNISEALVRDLIKQPNSQFYVGGKGWIYPKET